MALKRWITSSLKNGMIASVTLPLLFALVISAMLLAGQVRTLTESRSLEQKIGLISGLSALVHEQQKERGATSVFLNSGGTVFGPELKAQRELTDSAAEILRATLASLRIPSNEALNFPPIGDKPPASSRSASANLLMISPPEI